MLCKVKGSINFYTRFTAPNGTRICRSTGTKDKKLAQEYEDHLKETFWRAKRLGQIRHTWDEAVVAYSLGKDVSRWHLGILHDYCHGRYLDDLGDVRDRVVRDRLADGVSNATVNRTLEVFRSVLRTADKKKWVKAPYIEMLDEPPARIRWITHEEAERLISELPGHLKLMVRFSLATGLRETNVTGLEWSKVDLQRKVAWVDAVDAKTEIAYHVSLYQDSIEVLRECIGKHLRWVFTFEDDRVLRMNNTAWRKALERAGIENFRVHDLRHTWASWHVQNGTPLPVLQKLGGWRSISMVMKYAHLGQSHIAEYAGNCAKVSAVADKVLLAKDA